VAIIADVLVELEEVGDLLSNDLSDDDSTGLRESALRSEDASVDSSLDLDGFYARNVVHDLRSASESGVSLESDVSGSNDVDDPLSVDVAVRGVFPSGLRELGCVDRDVVLRGVDVIALDVDLRSIEHGRHGVVRNGSKSARVALIASGSGVEVLI